MSDHELQEKAVALELLAEKHQKTGLTEQLDALPMQERIEVAKLMQVINQQRLVQDPNLPHLEVHVNDEIGEDVSGVAIDIKEEKNPAQKLLGKIYPDPFDSSNLKTESLYQSREKAKPKDDDRHFTPA